MSMKSIKDLRELSAQDLHEELKVLRKGYLDLRLSASASQLRDTSLFKKTRAQIARVLTCLRNKQG